MKVILTSVTVGQRRRKMVQLAVYTKALALASLCLLLPQCIAEKLNAFDMRVFSTSMKDISEKVNRMESLLTNTSNALFERFERTQGQVEGKLVSTNDGLKQLENTVLATVSSLQSSMSAAREDLNTNKKQWEEGLTKMSIIESSLNATGQGMEENKRDLSNLLATVSSIQTSLSTTRDELSINQRDWHDGLARISFIESSVNATRNGMNDNKKDLANVLSTMIAIQSSLTAAREELTDNKRNWDNAMASIQSVQSAVSTTRDEVAVNKKDLNDVVSSISSIQSSVSSTRDDVATNKRDMNNVAGSISSIQTSLSSTQTDVTTNKKDLNNAMIAIPAIQSSVTATRNELAELQRKFDAVLSRSAKCKSGWILFQNSCYFFSTTTADWNNGRQQCRNLGGDYAKISTDAEFTFITSHTVSDMWIGLNDAEIEGTFKWISDGTIHPINRAWWHSGQPDNWNNEDCVHVWWTKEKTLLNDLPCGTAKLYICQMMAETTLG